MTSKDARQPHAHQPPHVDHSLDQAASKTHKDPRAVDVGAAGTLDRNQPSSEAQSGHVDHGIDKVLKEDQTPHKDHGADPVHGSAHKDGGAADVGSGGTTQRK